MKKILFFMVAIFCMILLLQGLALEEVQDGAQSTQQASQQQTVEQQEPSVDQQQPSYDTAQYQNLPAFSPQEVQAYDKILDEKKDPLSYINNDKQVFEEYMKGKYKMNFKIKGDIIGVDLDRHLIATSLAELDYANYASFDEADVIIVEEDGSLTVKRLGYSATLQGFLTLTPEGELHLAPGKSGLMVNGLEIATSHALVLALEGIPTITGKMFKIMPGTSGDFLRVEGENISIEGIGVMASGTVLVHEGRLYVDDVAVVNNVEIDTLSPVLLGGEDGDFVQFRSEGITTKGKDVQLRFLEGNIYVKISNQLFEIDIKGSTVKLERELVNGSLQSPLQLTVKGALMDEKDALPPTWAVVLNGNTKMMYTPKGVYYDLQYYDQHFDEAKAFVPLSSMVQGANGEQITNGNIITNTKGEVSVSTKSFVSPDGSIVC